MHTLNHMIQMRALPWLFLCTALTGSAHEPEAHLPFDDTHEEDALVGHLHIEWDSRYFSEGRDNLDGGSLWTASLEMEWKCFTSGLWYGNSPDRDYDEMQMTLGLAETFGDFELYGNYTHLRYPSDDTFDNEIATGVNWSGMPFELELAAEAYYSFAAGGVFCELALNREIEISDRFTLIASSIYGMNYGYVDDGHRGSNNIALRLSAEFAITKSLAITAHTAYSWALDKKPDMPGDESLIDFFHGGIGLQLSF